MQPVFGDIYFIDRLVRGYDESYRLVWNERIHRHQVVSTKRKAVKEGVLNGRSLYALRDVDEVVFTCERGAPDMRVIWHLHETDVWRYPGGPEKFYDDMVRGSEQRKQKKDEQADDFVNYTAREHQPFVQRGFDGSPDSKVFHPVSKVV